MTGTDCVHVMIMRGELVPAGRSYTFLLGVKNCRIKLAGLYLALGISRGVLQHVCPDLIKIHTHAQREKRSC